MNFDLSDEQLAFQDAARAFALGEMAPHAAEWDEQAIFPRELIGAAGEMGFCGMYSPEKNGGMGLSRMDTMVIVEELAAACPSTAAFITIHNMATWMIANWGQESLQSEWGEALTSGQKLASYCLTEPGAGSDAASLSTSAKVDGNDYIVNGSKAFISGAGATDILVVMTRTGTVAEGARGITAIAIPADTAGIHYGKKEVKMGWNSQPTRTITFDNVRVPITHQLGDVGEGFKIAMRGLDGGRINIATCSLGAAQAALNATQSYMLERKQFGKTLASFQALQFKLADMATKLVTARQMVRLAAFKLDQNHPDKTTYCAMAKQLATDLGFEVCNEALQLHGGYGYIREYPLERLMRDARVHQILEGSNEIMRVIIARRMLEENATETLR